MRLSARSFLVACAAAAACVVASAWAYTAAFPMAFLEGGYPVWRARQSILRECRFGDVAVFGDSRPEAAIVPSLLPFPAANISFGASTPVETYFWVRELVKCPRLPRIVIYSHSLANFLKPNQFLWKNAARFGYLGFADLRAIARTAHAAGDPGLDAVDTHDGLGGIVRDIVYGARFPSIYMASLTEGRGFQRYAHNMDLYERTARTMGQIAGEPGAGMDKDAPVAAFVPPPLLAHYFEATMALLRTAGVPVAIVAVPVDQATQDRIGAAAMQEYARFIDEAAAKYNSPVRQVRIVAPWPEDAFTDGRHMNPRGAAAFTALLGACLESWADTGGTVACDLGRR